VPYHLGRGALPRGQRRFYELTGYNREEVIGKSHKALQQWSSPEDLAKLRKLGEDDFHNLELSLRTRRGEVRTVLLSRVIIELEGERVNLKQFYDITRASRTKRS
jgi:PAS domain S-box-containing protein